MTGLVELVTNAIFLNFAGLKSEAKWYLSKFSWGHSFIELNSELLETYSACKSSKEILAAQDEYLQKVQAEKLNRRNEPDFPPTSSSESDDDDDGDDAEGRRCHEAAAETSNGT